MVFSLGLVWLLRNGGQVEEQEFRLFVGPEIKAGFVGDLGGIAGGQVLAIHGESTADDMNVTQPAGCEFVIQ